MSLNTLQRGPTPQDAAISYAVLDGMTGSRTATHHLLTDRRWPGAEMVGVETLRANPIRLAQATMGGTAGTMGDFAPPMRGIPLPKGAVLLEGAVITAAAVLTAIDIARERAAVEDVVRRYGLDRTNAADLLAARAYVWTVWMAPLSHWALPFDGPVNQRAAELVMYWERSHPGTTGMAVSGRSRSAMTTIDGLIDDAILGPITAEPLERTSAVNPALSTTSTRARTLAGTQTMQQWVAHHLIPFAVMAAQPVPVQLAIVASGWMMDSVENLIALPANAQAFMTQPSRSPFPPLPFQQGPHPKYDIDAVLSFSTIAAAAATMSGPTLRAALLVAENFMRGRIVAGNYLPRLS